MAFFSWQCWWINTTRRAAAAVRTQRAARARWQPCLEALEHRLAPAVTINEFTAGLSPGSFPTDIAAGPDGNLWFTEQNGNRIGRITPGGTITEFAVGLSPGGVPIGITAGPDGNLWFTEYFGN